MPPSHLHNCNCTNGIESGAKTAGSDRCAFNQRATRLCIVPISYRLWRLVSHVNFALHAGQAKLLYHNDLICARHFKMMLMSTNFNRFKRDVTMVSGLTTLNACVSIRTATTCDENPIFWHTFCWWHICHFIQSAHTQCTYKRDMVIWYELFQNKMRFSSYAAIKTKRVPNISINPWLKLGMIQKDAQLSLTRTTKFLIECMVES